MDCSFFSIVKSSAGIGLLDILFCIVLFYVNFFKFQKHSYYQSGSVDLRLMAMKGNSTFLISPEFVPLLTIKCSLVSYSRRPFFNSLTEPRRLGLENTPTASLQRDKIPPTSVLDMTKQSDGEATVILGL